MAPAARAFAGLEIERCRCGVMETRIRGERVEMVAVQNRCPTFELRARLRRAPLPRAEVIR